MALTLGAAMAGAMQVGSCLSMIAKMMEEACEERGKILENSFDESIYHNTQYDYYIIATPGGWAKWPDTRMGYTMGSLLGMTSGYYPMGWKTRFYLPATENVENAGTDEEGYNNAHMWYLESEEYYEAIGEDQVIMAVGDCIGSDYAPLKHAAGYTSIFSHVAGFNGTMFSIPSGSYYQENITGGSLQIEATAAFTAMKDPAFFDEHLLPLGGYKKKTGHYLGSSWVYFVSPALNYTYESLFEVTGGLPYAPSSEYPPLLDKDNNPIAAQMTVFMENFYYSQYDAYPVRVTSKSVYKKTSEVAISDYHAMRDMVDPTQFEQGPWTNIQEYGLKAKVLRNVGVALDHVSKIT